MNVTHIITSLGVGGAEKMVVSLSNGLISRGHVVNCVIIKDDWSLSNNLHNNIQKVSVLEGKRMNLGRLIKIARIIKASDVVHAHMFHSLVLITLLCPGKKVIWTSHNTRFSKFREVIIYCLRPVRFKDILLFDGHEGWYYKKISKVIIPNASSFKNEVMFRSKIEASKLNRFRRCLYVGSLTKQKNIKSLILIFKEIKSRYQNVFLDICGDGNLRGELEEFAQRNGLKSSVRFNGIVDNIHQVMGESDVLLLTSLWEGLPIVLLEAATCKLPIVSYPVGGVRWLLSEGRGFVVSNRDDFIAVVLTLLEQPEVGKEAAEKLNLFTKEELNDELFVKRHINIYKDSIR